MASLLAWWLLAHVLLVLCFAYVSSRKTRTILILFGACLPALMVMTVVNRNSPAFGEVRLRLHGVSFARAALAAAPQSQEAARRARPIRIGGQTATDDLFLDGLPATLATIDASAILRAYPLRPPHPPLVPTRRPAEAAILSVARDTGEVFMGAYAIHAEDRFCVESCSLPGASWFSLTADEDRLVRTDGTQLPIFPARWIGYYRPSQAIYPLRDYGRIRGLGAGAVDPCINRFLCDRATRQPVRSFLFRDGESQIFLALLDGDSVLERRGGADVQRIRAAEARPLAALGGADPASTITVWEAVYAEADVDFSVEIRSSHLVARRRFDIDLTPDRVALTFKRQPTIAIARQDVAMAARQLVQDRISSPVAVTLSGVAADPDRVQRGSVIVLNSIGGSLANAISPADGNAGRLIFVHEYIDDGAAPLALPEVRGGLQPVTARFGTEAFRLGSADVAGGGRAVDLSIDQFTYPDLLLPVVAFWGLLFFFLQLAAWGECRTALIISLVLQTLLLLRVFVAIGSAGFDPQIDYRALFSAALVSSCMVPFAAAALFPRGRVGMLDFLPCGLALAALALVLYRSNGLATSFLIAALLVSIFGICSPLVRRLSSVGQRADDGTAPSWWSRLLRVTASFLLWITIPFRRAIRHTRRVPVLEWIFTLVSRYRWLFLGLFLVAMRLLLLAFHVQERLEIPGFGRLALSVIYLPSSLFICAGLVVDVMNSPTRGSANWATLRLLIVVGLLFGFIPWAVSDKGFAFVYLPPILLVPLAYVWRPAGSAGRALAIAPAALVGLAFAASISLAVLQAPTPTTATVETATAPLDEGGQLARLHAATDRSTDWWRVDAVINPDAVNEAGTGAAEQIRRWRYLLATFTERAEGWGFPYVADISDLRPVQSDDNVSAVHLMGAFGRTAAAMFVLLLGVAAALLVRANWAVDDIRKIAGSFAAWVLFAAAAYMVLANLVMVPFTGRNIYFLAARSNSDLLEGFVLVGMIFLGLTRPPNAGEIP